MKNLLYTLDYLHLHKYTFLINFLVILLKYFQKNFRNLIFAVNPHDSHLKPRLCNFLHLIHKLILLQLIFKSHRIKLKGTRHG